MNEKERRLATFCRQHGYDGVLLRRRANIAWLTDGADTHCDTSSELSVAALVWTPKKKLILTDNIESPRLRAEELGREWEILATPWWKSPERPKGRLATDHPRDRIAELRNPLTKSELRRIRSLGRDSADVMERVMKSLRPGLSEHETAGRVAGALRSRGIFAHVLLVAADRRIDRYRHPIPTNNRIRRKIMVAICAQRSGLIVSITRLVHFGKLPAELRRKHDAVCRVDAALHCATQPGTRWCDALAEGIRVYSENGFGDEWQKHHQGGPMGYEARDFKATPSEKRVVQPNQAVGWNPSITGTKSEDTILSGGEIITTMDDWPMIANRPDILVRRAPRSR